MHKLIVLFAVSFFCQTCAYSQSSKESFRTSVLDRDLSDLLTAIDTFDKGNYNFVYSYGLLPSGSETHSKLKQVLSDPRVGRIFSLLMEMPKEKAASVVSDSFEKSFQKFKSVGSPTRNYGMHAKLWLSFHFESRKAFNKKFDLWLSWYANKLAEGRYFEHLKNEMNRSSRRKMFEHAFAPELLMYVNLVLIDQSSSAEGLRKLQQLVGESGFRHSISLASKHNIYPPEGLHEEPLIKDLPCLLSWGGLDNLAPEHRAILISKLQDFFVPEAPFNPAIFDLVETLKQNIYEIDDPANRILIALRFLGSNSKARLAESWSPMCPPSKKRILSSAERILKQAPENEKAEWAAQVMAMRKWMSTLPNTGIKVQGVRAWEWPRTGKEMGNSKLRIRLVVRDYHAFVDKTKGNKKERIKN